MEFLVLSLPEAKLLYMGLAAQALVRQSGLRKGVYVMVLGWTLLLILRAVRSHQPSEYTKPIGYFMTCLLLAGLFWPETTPFGRGAGRPVTAAQVASYAATQDPEAEIITAEDTGEIPQGLQAPPLVPPFYRLLLRVVVETPLALGRVINQQAHRTFAALMPMSWFLEVKLPAEMRAAVADWTHGCYLPTLLEMLNGQAGRTIEDLLPFGGSPLRQQLALHSVVPSAQTGITWLQGPESNNLTPCHVYLSALELQAQRWLSTLQSPRGRSYLELFETELGLPPAVQGAMLLYREMLYALGPGVPAPSLTAQYAKLRGLSVLGSAAEGAGIGGVMGGWAGLGLGFLTGTFRGVGSEFQKALDALSWLVRAALFLIWYGPYVLGMLNLVLIALFPFVLLWAMIPGTQFEPLAHYVMALLFLHSLTLWWALVDVMTRVLAQPTTGPDDNMSAAWNAFVVSGLWQASLTAIGIIVMAAATGFVYFRSFRAVGSLWRGGV